MSRGKHSEAEMIAALKQVEAGRYRTDRYFNCTNKVRQLGRRNLQGHALPRLAASRSPSSCGWFTRRGNPGPWLGVVCSQHVLAALGAICRRFQSST